MRLDIYLGKPYIGVHMVVAAGSETWGLGKMRAGLAYVLNTSTDNNLISMK